MEIQASIEILIPDKVILKSLFSALKPESEKTPTERSITNISIVEDTIIIKISTNDLTSLRASINSYFKWLKAVIESLKVISDVRPK